MRFLDRLFQSKDLSRFLRGGFILTCSNVLVGILGYLFQIYVGRFLSPEEFALFSSLIALYMLLGSPLVFVNMLVVKRVSVSRALDQLRGLKVAFFRLQKLLLILSFLLIIFVYGAQDILVTYIKSASKPEMLALSMLLSANLFFVINNAYLQGLQFFGKQSLTHLLFAVGKLILGGVFVISGWGVLGALLGVTISTALSALLADIFIYSILKGQESLSPIQDKTSNDSNGGSISILVMSIAFALLTQFDMILVNWLYSPEEAGMYAAASVLGKAVLYIPSGLVIALFPMIVEGSVKDSNTSHILKLALSATLMMCGILALIYLAYGKQLIALIYGASYIGAGSLLSWYGLAMLPLALIIILEHYLIAHGRALFSWIFLMVSPLQAIAIYFWHDQLINVVVSIACCGIMLLLIGLFLVGKDIFANKVVRIN